MSVAVRIEAVTKLFGPFPALRGVSLEVEPAELVALLGPSGSGKTTLLRVIAGLEEQNGGRVLFDDIESHRLSLRDRRIGFVFQHYALFRHMTVADNIAYGLKARPRRERPSSEAIRQRVGQLLDLVQLTGLEKRFPGQLSGGQRQRVALARALAIEPRVLLLDEPFGALDARVRKDLRQWLRDVHRRTGHTTLFVTHDQDEALELADRVAILNDGRIEQVGTPDDVYDKPATPFVCGFLGESNRIGVELAGGQAFLGDTPIFPATHNNGRGAADLFVRPQDVRMEPPGGQGLAGVVAAVRRHGAIRRAEVAVAGLARRLDVDLPSAIVPAIGETVGLKIVRATVFGPSA
ncbi:sulfate ABC transporter ATP-binding protein [Alsobacter soli]|uniref:Sulfate ABC transporter ATP-binding protein n=1 Tax=Alsobacter soli TaxID=2109933 RepID=A0A2T1HU23_9HYPH|nr:sulfate/molybdate ABC transporter ATP-binding protein [Alsobacter soli]PSC05142.1 sulfate ABC transporter ATP-binding protein [Alsobacter soli]